MGSHEQMHQRGSPKLASTEKSAKDWINQHWVNGWLTIEDKQRCLQEGRCFWCLEIGHRSTDCPTLREWRCASCQQMGHCVRECPLKITKCWTYGSKERDNPNLPCNHGEYSNQVKGPIIQTLGHCQWTSSNSALRALPIWKYPNHNAPTANKPSAV